ncbi:hypothetical protein ABOM_003572 [Aspergillus bombycis]|uniref:Cyanovirin-N domain-containing protein n=1 Tax=Aspergillus bombycis TaxID=109264 RepID=A0A1F8ACP8_9EURO|nr:hypothetical protein ABOM_003572 [Aspergillus bombycis]OGM49431.1 hypothetical protein ABOM_003572 [Aspergillus bombycis]
MYQTLILIVLYLSALAAAQPPANLQPAQVETINLHRSCSTLFIEYPLRQLPGAFAGWPDKRDSSTPIGSARRATRPPPPEPFLVGNCSTQGGQFRMTNLSLNNCLGWRDEGDSGSKGADAVTVPMHMTVMDFRVFLFSNLAVDAVILRRQDIGSSRRQE